MLESSAFSEIAQIRNKYSTIKSLLGNLSMMCLFSGIGFVAYSYTAEVEIFSKIGEFLLALTVPMVLACTSCNHFEENAVEKCEREEELKKQTLKQKKYLEHIKQITDVKDFVICTSLDYSSGRELTHENKVVLNKIIFSKIKEILNNLAPEAVVTISDDILIVEGCDFYKYDKIYGLLLRSLSKIKKDVEEKYAVDITASTTTDAFKYQKNTETIKRSHRYIKDCNFRNRACTTSVFSNKYKYLKQSKYLGTPIGEYAILNKDDASSYELNIVYKNLSDVLAAL